MSIPSNIAEGAARRSTPECLRYLSSARGSLPELDTQLQIGTRLEYLTRHPEVGELIDRLFARLTAPMNSLKLSGDS